MKRIVRLLAVQALVVAFGLLLLSTPSYAGTSASKTHTSTPKSHWMFNPKTMETVQGKVAGVSTEKGRKSKMSTEWLNLKTDHGTLPVLLGPASYVGKEKVKLSKGDDISVTGSRVIRNKKTELVATEIKKGNETLDLRKSDGTPLWSHKAMQGR
jgi:hypothetical protein